MTSRTALSWPAPPSMKTTSGQSGMPVVLVLGVGVAFGGEAGEAAGQHFAHHAEIVAGGDVGRFDVEGAVVLFRKPSSPGDDHGADGIGAEMWELS